VRTLRLRQAVVAAWDQDAAERYMNTNGGDCGYMAIFQVDDLEAARAHLRQLGLRTVLDADLDDIRCTHVHPADLGVAIVSFDQAIPAASWRWAGPRWTDEIRTDVVTGVAGVRLATKDPALILARWAAALAVGVVDAYAKTSAFRAAQGPTHDGREFLPAQSAGHSRVARRRTGGELVALEDVEVDVDPPTGSASVQVLGGFGGELSGLPVHNLGWVQSTRSAMDGTAIALR